MRYIADESDDLLRAESLLSSIGNTPLLRLRRVVPEQLSNGVELFAKAEHLNPGGSVKDRAGLAMILDGEKRGTLTPEKIILDATSGNTGTAYAMIGAALGYRVALCLPQNASRERKRVLRSYGAELIETDALQGTDGAQLRAREIVAAQPDRFFYPDQYNNDANWRAHYETTGPEILRQTEGRVTHFVAGLGTSGTFVGTTRRLKENSPRIQCISVQPDSPLHGLEGMKHMRSAIVPGIYDPTLADENVEVATEDAQEMTRRLARQEGLLVGVSAGANVFAAVRLMQRVPPGSLIITVLCDDGAKYLGERFWETETL
jgi:cysteine synthase B